MIIEVLDDAEVAAKRAAAVIAGEARASCSVRGRFVLAVSGGRTPWVMLRILSTESLPWERVHVLQVDERVAPEGHPDRNLPQLRESLLDRIPLRPDNFHPMPVDSTMLESAALQFALALRDLSGTPPVLDLVQLGLGPDGHTASLVPGDPALDVTESDLAVTGIYQGRRRMTLTYPIINRSRRILWLVTGGDKAEMLSRLREGDESIPAGRVRRADAMIIADRAAAGGLKNTFSA